MKYLATAKLRGSKGQSEFAFNFPYLKQEDIYVTVDGRPAGVTFTSPNTVVLHEPLVKASDVVIVRRTKADDRLVEFSDNAELTADDLDVSALQQFYLVQEAYDITTDAVVKNGAGNWDAQGGRIVSVGDAVDPMDALNLRTFEKLSTDLGNQMWEYVNEARAYAEKAEAEVEKAAGEVAKAAKIQEAVQGIHDATDEIRNDARQALVETINERQKAESAVVSSREWAEKSAYWYEVFRTIYHGSRADHPAGDVANGSIYYNTTENRLYFYTGSQWYSPTTDADRAEAARRFVESMRNEVSNMRDQTQVYSQQAQDFVTDAQDAANAAGMSAGVARGEAAAAANHAQAAEIAAGVANERASAADGSAKLADAAAGRAETAATQVGETFGDRGGWYVAHGMPTKPIRSSLWTVMDGGELDGVEWNVGDMLVYSIKTNSFGRITGASITPSEPAPIEAEEGLILGDGKFIRARVAANIRWIAHANSEGVKLGDNAVELHLLGNNMVFGALKHPVFHKGNLPTWDDVTGKPESFPVGAHSHKWDEITGKPASALRWPTWFEVTDKPTYFPPVSHGHSWNEISNKPDTALRWPTAAEAGAAPEGHGLGTYGTTSRDADSFGLVSGFYAAGGDGSSNFYDSFAPLIQSARSGGADGSGFLGQIQLVNGKLVVRTRSSNVWTPWNVLYGSANKPTAADVKARPDNWVPSWSDITGKPDSYPVDGHTHLWSDLRDIPDYAKRWPTAAEAGALSVNGGVVNGPVTVLKDTHMAFVAERGEYQLLAGISVKPGEYLFGGKAVASADYDHYIRIGSNLFQFHTNGNTHTVYTSANKPTAADVKARPDNWVPSWGDVTGKPATFPAAAHSHSWSSVTDKPSTFPPSEHTHDYLPISAGKAVVPGIGGAPGGTLKNQKDGDNSVTWLTNKPDSDPTHKGIGVGESKGAVYWDGTASRRIFHEGAPPSAAQVGAAALNHGHARQFGSEQTLTIEDLDTIKTPGLYVQPANANTSAERHYPELLAGSLMVVASAGVSQRYHVYNTSRIYTRSQYSDGAWTPWAREYNTLNPPTAAEVGAFPVSGGFTDGRMGARGAGNDYHLGAFEARGDGGGVLPSYGFHQPGVFAGSIAMMDAGTFKLLRQGWGAYADMRAGAVYDHDQRVYSPHNPPSWDAIPGKPAAFPSSATLVWSGDTTGTVHIGGHGYGVYAVTGMQNVTTVTGIVCYDGAGNHTGTPTWLYVSNHNIGCGSGIRMLRVRKLG